MSPYSCGSCGEPEQKCSCLFDDGDGGDWVDCWSCGGSGFTDHDCGEDTCMPVRLDTWIPLQQEAADTIDALRARVAELEGKVTAIVGWLEREQPDVFRRGLWDALREVPSAGAGL